jgi:pimeloyl-ACP methyl ester carboxylesterase
MYAPNRPAVSQFLPLRGLRYHVLAWGDRKPGSTPLVLLHGWMDVGASFQFVVDALEATPAAGRWIVSPDWRGFGHTQDSGADSYWFPDYLGDLDALLDAIAPDTPVDLLGHSMGGNVVMTYAGVRPARIRTLINLEGFGLPRTEPRQARTRLAAWLDSLREEARLRPYASLEEVAARLMKTNPRLGADKANWLAPHWAEPVQAAAGASGSSGYRLLGDPAHKRPNPVLYRVDEMLETWRAITAPMLWMEAELSTPEVNWGGRYSKAEFHERLNVVANARREVVPGAGHMLHHDQPEAVARLLADFLPRE